MASFDEKFRLLLGVAYVCIWVPFIDQIAFGDSFPGTYEAENIVNTDCVQLIMFIRIVRM